MKLFKKIARLFFGVTVGLALGTCVTITFYSKSYQPYKWKSSPIIANCYGDDFYELKLQTAVKYWRDKGEDIAFIVIDPPESVCSKDYIDGFIIIKKAPKGSLGEGTLARTHTKIEYLELRSALIHFEPGTQNLTFIVEHELGHALGWKHINEIGHIMNPTYELMGGKFWIP